MPKHLKIRTKLPPEIRFWRKVSKPTGPKKCLIWEGAAVAGFGLFRPISNSKYVSAHRYAWFLATGCTPPDGDAVRHTCGNKKCVLFAHLYTVDKRTLAPQAKLSAALAKQIRLEFAEASVAELALKYDVAKATIYDILNNDSW